MSDPLVPKLPRPAIPIHPDRDSAPYWEALSNGAFRLQACSECDALRWPPRALCNRCHSFDHAWKDVARTGRVVSWTRTHQVFSSACQDIVPYFVVQIALDAQADILMIGAWLDARAPRADEPVEMELVDSGEGRRLPCWKPVTSRGSSSQEGAA